MADVTNRLGIGVFGASGYGGSELLRLLLFHPFAEIVFATAGEQAGRRVSDVHRNLGSLCDLEFVSEAEGVSMLEEVDAAFFALPHGMAMELVPSVPERVAVIDLSGDFRLSDPHEFSDSYGIEHSSHELQSNFVYGLPEINRGAISAAKLIANPGCFATAALLALHPLATAGFIEGRVVIDAKTGSSGSGAKAASNTHHPVRANSFYAYKPFTHQHLPEIRQTLAGSGFDSGEIVFMTHSLPVSRGIYASCYLQLKENLSSEELRELYENAYLDEPFVRISVDPPNINWVKMTNFCDISVHSKGRETAVFAAIDNLVKGAAGQAIQNLNIVFGLKETAGLLFPGTNP